MDKERYFTTGVVFILLTSSCIRDYTAPSSTTVSENINSVVYFQKRNPSLPLAVDLKTYTQTTRTIGNDEIINSDSKLGFTYHLKNGNYILGDAANLGDPIIDLQALKQYDPKYVKGIKLNVTETKSFSYGNYDRYYHRSKITDKITTGFSLKWKAFSVGREKTTTDIFSELVDNTLETAFGELNINFADKQFTLQGSEASRRLFARKFLTRSFIRSLYNSTIASTLNSYGGFVITGHRTGGKAYATYAITSLKTMTINQKEHIVDDLINASVTDNNDSGSLNIGSNLDNYYKDSLESKNIKAYMFITTLGGIKDGSTAIVKARDISSINIDLSSWMRSLADESNYTMVDIADGGLTPLSGFVLETNFKRRLDDTMSEVLYPFDNLTVPHIEVVRVLVRLSDREVPLYDVVPILVTRQSDLILLKERDSSSVSDEELISYEDQQVFLQKAKELAERKSLLFSSDIEILINKKTRVNTYLRSPLCMDINVFHEGDYRRYYNEKTEMGYIYNPNKKIVFPI